MLDHQCIGVSEANEVINDRSGQTRITQSLPNNLACESCDVKASVLKISGGSVILVHNY